MHKRKFILTAVGTMIVGLLITFAIAEESFKAPEGPLKIDGLLSETNLTRSNTEQELEKHFYAQIEQLEAVAKQKIDWDSGDGASVRAIRLLALYRDKHIVGFLLENVDHRLVGMSAFEDVAYGRYPCVAALIKIGGPTSELVVRGLSALHTPESQRKWWVTVLKEIEGEKYAELKIRDAMKAERDAGKREMLSDVLEKYFNE